MSYSIDKPTVDAALFSFLKSIYMFELQESVRFGVTWNEIYLLQLVIRQPGLRISLLSRELRVKNFVTSRMLTRLEQDGLLTRVNADPDKRVVNIYPTKEGIEKIEAIEAYHYETVASNFAKLPEETMRMLLQSISRLDLLLQIDEHGSEGV